VIGLAITNWPNRPARRGGQARRRSSWPLPASYLLISSISLYLLRKAETRYSVGVKRGDF
jgi:hypothetical protein